MAAERFPVCVLMARTRVQGKWASERWEARGVIADTGESTAVRTLLQGEHELQRLHPGCAIELRRDEAQGYYLNISAPSPSVFVMWRLRDDEAVPVLVTVSYDEAARWLDAGENVDAVALPQALMQPIMAFAQAHYTPETKRARKRDRSAVPEDK